jgi:hypothetical protein
MYDTSEFIVIVARATASEPSRPLSHLALVTIRLVMLKCTGRCKVVTLV